MQFKPVSWEDTDVLFPFANLLTGRECDPTPGCTLMWREECRITYSIEEKSLFICLHDEEGRPYYGLPVSRDHKAAVQRLVEACKGLEPLCFTTVPETHLPLFRSLFPNCEITEQRDYADYLYNAEGLKTLSGRKLSAQRNQMSQYRRNHPNWTFEAVTEANLPAVINYLQKDFIDNPKVSEEKKAEDRMAMDMLLHLDKLPLSGGLLREGDCIHGFAFGEALGDTLYVHIEKANREVKGAYQMVVNQFALLYAGEGIAWINREDDSGDPGLRRVKESYLPACLLNKYQIIIP